MTQSIKQSQSPIAVLGAGSWGTALALYLSRRGQQVRIWSIEKSEIDAMVAERANNRYLPGIALPESMHPLLDLQTTVKDVEDILLVVPSVGVRQTLTSLKDFISPTARIICASKGLDLETGEPFSEVITDVLGKNRQFAVLSGPSFAKEVAQGLPCAVVIASEHKDLIQELITRFDSDIFRVFPSDDVIGVEVGGVAKNVIAIATGMSDGLELGVNARCALITFGLQEITRLGLALGAKPETFTGLSGLGDLILTAGDNQSRNKRFGLALGSGKDIKTAQKEIGQVVEGKRNAELITQLAAKHHVEMPICQMVWNVLQGKVSAKDSFNRLFCSK